MFFDFTFRVPLPFRNPFASTSQYLDSNPGDLQPPPVSRHSRDEPRLGHPSDSQTPGDRRQWLVTEPTRLPSTLNTTVLAAGHLNSGLERRPALDYPTDESSIQDLEFPPAKRRRTLADSLLTSALNVALMSTALGMTAYRMWSHRDESAVQDGDCPPPYEEGDWVKPYAISISKSPAKRVQDNYVKPYRRRGQSTHQQSRIHAASSRRKPAFMAPARPASPIPRRADGELSDLSSPRALPRGEIDDQMDFMSAQLQNLINEGRKALGREIVVDTDVPCAEDEIEDDGDQAWGDEIPLPSSSRLQREGLRSSRRSMRGSLKSSHRTYSPASSANGETSTLPRPVTGQKRLRCHSDELESLNDRQRGGSSGMDLKLAMDRVRKAYGLDVQ